MSDSENPKRSGPKPEDDSLGSFYMGRMRPPPEPKRVMPRGLLTILTLIAFAIIIWYAYPRGHEKYSGTDIPVISADTAPYKFKPEDPGGMEVRHQDLTVFDPLVKKDPDAVEHLRPTPEQPLDKTALKADAPIDDSKPEMNLDLKMEKLPSGSEKVVTTEEAADTQKTDAKTAEKPVQATEPKIEAAAKPAAKKPEDAKTESAKTPPVSKPAASKPAASTAAPKGIFVQLGSYRDASGAEGDWKKLQKKYAQYLSGLGHQMQRIDLGSKGVWNRLYAGPVSDSRAQEICAALKTQNAGGCIISRN